MIKRLLLIVMLLKGIAFGQNTQQKAKIDSIINVKVTDTIPRLMLVTKQPSGLRQDGFFVDSSAYMIKGYEVREETGFLNFHWLYEDAEPVMQHKEYLDADKQPLHKNVVVWQTK